jgi:hypothetical protein
VTATCTAKEKGKKLGKKNKKKIKKEHHTARHGMPRWDGAQVENHKKSWLL